MSLVMCILYCRSFNLFYYGDYTLNCFNCTVIYGTMSLRNSYHTYTQHTIRHTIRIVFQDYVIYSRFISPLISVEETTKLSGPCGLYSPTLRTICLADHIVPPVLWLLLSLYMPLWAAYFTTCHNHFCQSWIPASQVSFICFPWYGGKAVCICLIKVYHRCKSSKYLHDFTLKYKE